MTKQHWDDVWSRRAPDEVSWHQAAAERSLRLIQSVTPELTAAIVDVGAGASPLVDGLLGAGYTDVTVMDIAAGGMEHARARLGHRAAAVRWVTGDVTRHDLGRRMAVWHDRAVLHFLTDEQDRQRYVDRLVATVAPGGHAVLAPFADDGPEACSGLAVRRYSVDDLTDLVAPAFEPVTFERESHTTPGGVEQRFVYGVLRRVA